METLGNTSGTRRNLKCMNKPTTKRILIILFLLHNLSYANAQLKTDTNMIEKYNYEATKGGTKDTSFLKDGWVIDIRSQSMVQMEYAPAKDFYMIVKTYHKNGMIKTRGKLLGNVPFGICEYFDENGQLIERTDEDAKFGKIKPDDLVDIIEKVGWINRETGENCIVESPLKTDGTFYAEIIRKLDIYFSPAEYSENGEEIKPPMWSFGYLYFSTMITYIVNGNTGEYERQEMQYIIEM